MLQPDQVLGDFSIVRLLGKGGMGEVYEARQTNPSRPVALKVLAAHLSGSDEARDRFEREIAVLARLDHPNIVRIFTSGRTADGLSYYTMQLVRGITLVEFLRRAAQDDPTTVPQAAGSQESTLTAPDRATAPDHRGPLGRYRRDRFGWVIEVGLAVARALAHAHREGVLHRDIKPANVMLDDEGHVFVVDFGLVRALDPEADGSRSGVVRGTPYYMSPEQARGEPLDARSDLYSLGVTLYELAAGGQGPYAASRGDQAGVLEQVRKGETRPLRSLVPDVPEELEAVLLRCLEHDPARRWPDARELVVALERLRGEKPPPPPRRWPLVLAAGALAGLTFLLFAGGQPQPEPRPELQPQIIPAAPIAAAHPPLWDPTFPKSLRQLERGVPTALQQDTGDPIWKKRVMGPGTLRSFAGSLMVISPQQPPGPPTTQVTLFALYENPDRRPYRVAINVGRSTNANQPNYAMGLFFGRREAEPESRFFLVHVDFLGAPQRAAFGSALVTDGDDIQAACFEMARGFGARDIGTPLGAPVNQRHSLVLTVSPDVVKLVVDRGAPLELNVPQIRLEPSGVGSHRTLQTHGTFGVWVRDGIGYFENATVTCLEAIP